ncbi:MAG: adenylate/guanylate cyclase domain-containing protein [Verrucomicrobiota bacterium]
MNEIRRLADDLKVRNDFIKQILGRYVTDAVVENVLENPKGLELGGQRRTVSVLMSDLRGFTQLSEQLSPEQVVEVLNVYLGAMAEVIAQHHGVVDAFIGDAVIGVFGSPIIREDHPALAVACALAMQADMERVNRRLSRLGIAALEMGIGINTGEVVVGNIGSDKRAQYSVIGAQVNLTARIQGVSVGGEVLVSQTTAAAVAAHLKTERTFTISSKGVGAPIHIHSVMGLRGQDHLDLPQSNHFEAGLHKKLPVKYQRLTDDKSLFGQGTDAELVIVTSRSGFLKAIELLHARCDLKLILPPTPTGASSDLYCKVMDEQPGENGWFVRFTSPFVG